jgi:hypothetical protein
VSVFGESLDEIVLQLESGVICGDVYAHGSTMADRAPDRRAAATAAQIAEELSPGA